jgi:cytochrome c oxidase subunit 3
MLGLTLLLGISFGYFQFQGWKQLHSSGNALSGTIININGQYGKYYTFFYEGKEISYNNAEFFYKGEKIGADLMSKMKAISAELMEGAKSKDKQYKLSSYGSEFTLRYKGDLVTFVNNTLYLNDTKFSQEQHSRLWYFAENIKNDRGDFIMKGKYGEDFDIYYHGKLLAYENRTFYIDGRPLSPKQLNDLNMQDNTASSYIYAFTFLHLLHWLGGVIALLVMFINGLRLKYSATEIAGLKLGSTYWHFLGILWLYLYAFLIFIH